jgi:hypothetical protein
MAEPILAKDAVIMFKKFDFWHSYVCATDVVINFELETKSIKTIGDGYWEKLRGQKVRYSIELGGLIKIYDDYLPHAFDLLSYLTNMVTIEFQMVFTDDTGTMRVIKGHALPTNVSLGGGSEGFANGSATLIGDGEPEIRTSLAGCNITIEDAEVFQEYGQNKFRVNNTLGGTVLRYEYSINGSGRYTSYSNEWTLPFPYPLEGSDYSATITVWAICENGSDGIAYQEAFTYGDPN